MKTKTLLLIIVILTYMGNINILSQTKYHGGIADGYASSNTANDVSLPVELISFRIIVESCQVKIIWITESEVDNLGFIIKRKEKTDPDWQVIASYKNYDNLKGQGNSAVRTEYQFADKEVSSEHTYLYRLLNVDVNGNVTIKKTVEIKMHFIPEHMDLLLSYPNPFNPFTTISYYLSERTKVFVTIFDIQGRVVRSLVNGKNQETGVYIVKWDGKDDIGRNISSGIYIINFKARNFVKSQRIILMQ